MKKIYNLLERTIALSLASLLVAVNVYPYIQTPPPVIGHPDLPVIALKPLRFNEAKTPSAPQHTSPITVQKNLKTSTTQTDAIQVAEPSKKTATSRLINEYVLGDSIVSLRDGQSYPLLPYTPATTPTDPNSGQWWETTMNLPQAWNNSTGSNGTILAIIDTGFALNHEEFSGRWQENSSEMGSAATENPSLRNCTDQMIALDKSCNLIDDNFDGVVDNETGTTSRENTSQLNCSDQSKTLDKNCNLVDDDENGFVDDWRGWDFVNFDRSVEAGETDQNGSGTHHATYVTGVAAANANNGVGIAGVNWQTKILPLQALADEGGGTTLSVARAIGYAVDHGADVISMSLGGSLPDAYLRQAIRDAVAAGVVVVAASGNDGCNCISYPANYEEVVAVGALNQSNTRASFSSYGANLDILAPGVNMYTATWTPSNQTSAYASGIAGTSLATPLVSASLALLKSIYPNANSSQLLAILTESANRLTIASTTSRSDTLGFGTADLYAATERALHPANMNYAVGLAGISHGQTLFSSLNLEASNALFMYECKDTNYGTTPLYYLAKSTTTFYSSSLSEVGQAKDNGFNATFIGYFCVALPNDSIESIRVLNTGLEFNAIFLKQ